MAFPSILAIWDDQSDGAAATTIAAGMARRFSAHLDVVCIGVDRTPTGLYAVEPANARAHDFMAAAWATARNSADLARAFVEAEGIATTVRAAAIRFGEIPAVISRAAWHQDLTVLTPPFGREDVELAEAVSTLLFSARPRPF